MWVQLLRKFYRIAFIWFSLLVFFSPALVPINGLLVDNFLFFVLSTSLRPFYSSEMDGIIVVMSY